MHKIKGKPLINSEFERKLQKFKTDQEKWVQISKENLKVSYKNVFSDKIFKNQKHSEGLIQHYEIIKHRNKLEEVIE